MLAAGPKFGLQPFPLLRCRHGIVVTYFAAAVSRINKLERLRSIDNSRRSLRSRRSLGGNRRNLLHNRRQVCARLSFTGIVVSLGAIAKYLLGRSASPAQLDAAAAMVRLADRDR